MEIDLERFSGFSDLYDRVRPRPPAKLCSLILSSLHMEKLDCVVDLGCGTGLSTQIWCDHADRVIGIEPNSDMIKTARATVSGAEFFQADSYRTGLEKSSADLVTCSQSFHWMEPQVTLKEVQRILRPGGVFAVYDCDWPPAVGMRSEQAWSHLMEQAQVLTTRYAANLPTHRQWPKSRHLENMRSSAYFAYCREIVFENSETCDGQRFIDIALSQGHIQTLLKHEIPEIKDLIAEFAAIVLLDMPRPIIMSVGYRMAIAYS